MGYVTLKDAGKLDNFYGGKIEFTIGIKIKNLLP
jgi:hypothetical protein